MPGEIYHSFLEGLEEMIISYGHTLQIVRLSELGFHGEVVLGGEKDIPSADNL